MTIIFHLISFEHFNINKIGVTNNTNIHLKAATSQSELLPILSFERAESSQNFYEFVYSTDEYSANSLDVLFYLHKVAGSSSIGSVSSVNTANCLSRFSRLAKASAKLDRSSGTKCMKTGIKMQKEKGAENRLRFTKVKT
ncbi:hypothetical protein GQX74_001302 [Glossina fuscipes]|nr:hypothetical protein GQX74_001302 [Glossina fuscipes]